MIIHITNIQQLLKSTNLNKIKEFIRISEFILFSLIHAHYLILRYHYLILRYYFVIYKTLEQYYKIYVFKNHKRSVSNIS